MIALISHTSKAMFKILQARIQQYVSRELPDVQAGFRKDRGTRDQIVNIRWIIEKAREFQRNIYFCFTDYAKAFDCMDHNKLENSERDGLIRPPDLPVEKPVCRSGELQKNIYFCFTDYTKAFYCVDYNKLWTFLKEMEIPDHLTCLLRNLYAGQEATVRTGYGTTDWFQIGKGICQGCILSPCLFNFYMQSTS